MTQRDLFDDGLTAPTAARVAPAKPLTGEQRKEAGIKRAVRSHSHQVGIAREMAYDIARGVLPHADGEKRCDWLCTADDVAAAIAAAGMPPLGNEAGGVFRDGNWEAVSMTTAKRPASNGNLLRVWKRKVQG